MRRSPLLPLLAALAVLALYTYTLLRIEGHVHHGFLEDDAYISMRHAKNLVAGSGLTYNPGERVEAYTNFSLTMLMALPYALGWNAVLFVKAIGALAGAVLIVTTGLLTRRIAGAAPALVVMMVLALDERLAWFATCGLETVMVAAFYVPALLLLLRKRVVLAALLFVGAALTRMETVLLFGVALFFLVAQCRSRAQLRAPLRFLAAFAIPYGAYYTWRYAYYGWAFPNTYYAKVGSVSGAWRRGLEYLATCASSMHGWPALAITAVAIALGIVIQRQRLRLSARPSAGVLVAVSCLTYAAFAVSVGGDHFRERFVYHFYPLLLVTMAWAFRLCVQRLKPPRRGLVPAALLLVLLAPVAYAPVGFPPAWGMAAWESTGLWLRANARPTDLLATDAAGVIALESNLVTIDMLGLADRHIAHLDVALGSGTAGHEKSDPAYVLGRGPQWITTWVDDDGHIGRGFRRFYRFWRDYEVTGLVQKDADLRVSVDRVMRFEHAPSVDELVAWRRGRGPMPGQWSWAIWQRRRGPVPPRPLGRLDVGSQLEGALDHPGALVHAPRGHAPMHVLIGPGMVFPRGTYRASYDLKIRNVDANAPSGEICKFDVWDGVKATNEQTLTLAEWTDRDGALEATFEVSAEAETRRYEFRLYCFGVADVTVARGAVDVAR